MRFWCNALLSTIHSVQKEIISTFGRNLQKMLRFFGAFFVIAWRTMNCPVGMIWLTP